MNNHKEIFAEYASEYLLQKRALGSELSDEAHKAIEEIFAERGEFLPPRPSRPILIADPTASIGKTRGVLTMVVWLTIALVASVLAHALARTWIGVLVSMCIVVYLIFGWLRRGAMTSEQRKIEEDERKAEELGLNELMVFSANGNLTRVKELVMFGADVNARSDSGATALMYAVRNNHLPVVEFLLSAGADIKATATKGSTAAAIAKKCGYVELSAYLEQHDAQ